MSYYSTVTLAINKDDYNFVLANVKSQKNFIMDFDTEAARKETEEFLTTKPQIETRNRIESCSGVTSSGTKFSRKSAMSCRQSPI